MPQWLDSLKTRMGLAEEEAAAEQGLLQQFNEATTLDKTQRAIGFGVCVAIGLLLSFMVSTVCGAGLQLTGSARALDSSAAARRCAAVTPPPSLGAALLQAPMFIFRPTKFAATYSLGNVLSLSSTMFLMGALAQPLLPASRCRCRCVPAALVSAQCTLAVSPTACAPIAGPVNQLKRMFDSQRRLSTCIYLLALVLTLVSAIVLHSVRLCLRSAVQFGAAASRMPPPPPPLRPPGCSLVAAFPRRSSSACSSSPSSSAPLCGTR